MAEFYGLFQLKYARHSELLDVSELTGPRTELSSPRSMHPQQNDRHAAKS